ncbi:MAG: integrin alpha, partial [Pseudomonadota bacterium]
MASAQVFPAVIELSELDGTNGFVINGESAIDLAGISVSHAGDLNGDGIDDVIVGALLSDVNGTNSGRGYVLFGSDQAQPSVVELSSLNGLNGFALNGENPFDYAGGAVSSAGDINGDGLSDLIIGARYASPNGNESGRSYVVFGSDTGFPNPFQLSNLNGLNGFVLNGEAEDDRSGFSVGPAGDINSDGIDDLSIGAPFSDASGAYSGRGYVVFGSDSGLPNPFNLSSLNGLNGFVLNSEAANDGSSGTVQSAGDFNGDGIDDIIVSAAGSDAAASDAGRSYIVFGSDTGLPNPFNLSGLDGANGIVFNGESENDRAGPGGSIGDVNGDGIDDVIIGAAFADSIGMDSGRSYVVFGSQATLMSPFELSNLNGLNGFVLNGESPGDLAGVANTAGDVNGDGIDDVLIGAFYADPNGSNSGRTYVVFGSDSGLPNPFNLSSLNGFNGFVLNGEAEYDFSGGSVSTAGDFNGDGIGDIIIGARNADPNGPSSGRSYVVFGRASRDLAVTKTNSAAFVSTGSPTTWLIEVSNSGVSSVSDAVLTDPVPSGV